MHSKWHAPSKSFSLLYENPPYDWEIGEGQKPSYGSRISGKHIPLVET